MESKFKITEHPLYRKRRDMINRCTNPNVDRYNRYGGRGIKVCHQWLKSAKSFIEWACENGWEAGLTIERIDTNGDYSPDNCKFITPQEQHYNKTNSSYVIYKGIEYCLAEFVKIHFPKNYIRCYKCLWHNLNKSDSNEISEEMYLKLHIRYNVVGTYNYTRKN